MPAAEAGALVTFGIVPDAPETGFGYIHAEAGKAGKGDGVRKVLRFVEKPDAATAQRYLDAGGYYWNSGMFLLRASRYLDELAALPPRHRGGGACVVRCRARATAISSGWTRPRSPPVRRIPSTMR